jgi:outer membrane protein assembly factor BamB
MRSWGAIWVNPADKVAWVFVGGSGGLGAFTVNLDATGVPTLTQKWVKAIGWTTAPFVANGVLFASGGAGERTGGSATHPLDALDPATGNVLWTANVGPHHWSSPILVNGILYMADGHSGGCDVANGSPTCTPQGPGNVTAWSIR